MARVEPPYRARIDLFLDNGETAAIAALVDDDIRTPASLPYELVPVPPLLWAALGVFRPGTGARIVEGSAQDAAAADSPAGDGAARLTYALPGGQRARFALGRGGILESAELLDGRGSAVQRVAIDNPNQGTYPSHTLYRHLTDVRELSLTLESTEDADSFPAEIWTPGGR